jgi:hypothetical protein
MVGMKIGLCIADLIIYARLIETAILPLNGISFFCLGIVFLVGRE